MIDLKSNYIPKFILSIYEAENSEDVYVEKHKIRKEKQKYFIQNGEPIDSDTLKNLGSILFTGSTELLSGEIPSNMVASFNVKGRYSEIHWITEPKIVNLQFSEILQIPSGCYPIPRLLWVYVNGQLTIFHIDENNFLYHAGFPNVTDGSVCMGGASKFIKINSVSNTFSSIIRKVEYSFFNSVFTHFTATVQTTVNSIEFWKKQYNKETFNTKLLTPVTKNGKHKLYIKGHTRYND